MSCTKQLGYDDGRLLYGREYFPIERPDLEILVAKLAGYRLSAGPVSFHLDNEKIHVSMSRRELRIYRLDTHKSLRFQWSRIELSQLIREIRERTGMPEMSVFIGDARKYLSYKFSEYIYHTTPSDVLERYREFNPTAVSITDECGVPYSPDSVST